MTYSTAIWRLGVCCGVVLCLVQPSWSQGREAAYTAMVHEAQVDQPAGVIRLDERAQIEVISATTQRSSWLHDLARRMNAKQQLSLDAAPPAGAPARASASIPVERGDPRFTQALKLELLRYYHVTLVPSR